MTVRVKIGMEEIAIDMSIPDSNAILAEVLAAPVIRERNADRLVIPYPVSMNFRSPAHESWVRGLIHNNRQSKLDLQFSGKYIKNDVIRERNTRAFYFDGSYLSKNVAPQGCMVFSIAYNKQHETRIRSMAKFMGIEIDEMIMVDYGNYYHPTGYVHGSRWLAAIIGAMYAKVVEIPNTDEFWGEVDRSNRLYSEGADWISRYYMQNTNIVNPLRKTKFQMENDLIKYPMCTCGDCMECYTSHVITRGKTPMNSIVKHQNMLHSAIRMSKAPKEYTNYV